MYKSKIVAFSILTFLLTSCATSLEYVSVQGKLSGWKIGHQEREKFTNSSIREFIPANETIQNWSKMISIQYISGRKDNPEVFMNALKSRMEQQCKNTTWKTISKDKNSILYEWKISNCSPNSDQHEIARLFLGNDGLHRAAYTEKVKTMPNEIQKEWVNKLSNAYLAKDGKRVAGL